MEGDGKRMHAATQGARPRTATVTVQGIDIFVRETGAGRPVLFLHGNPDSADVWDEVIAGLAPQYRCIAVDLPGFGRSGPGADFDPRFENLARFVDALVAALGIDEPVNLVAHDYGGAFAMAWAASAPQRLRRLVVINHPFFVADYSWHVWARIWRTPLLGELSTLAMRRWPVFRKSLKAGSKKLSDAQIRAAHALMTPATTAMILRLYRAADPAEFARWQPRMLQATAIVPTLVIWGRHDPYIPRWVAARFGAREVVHLDDCGHWVPAEMPERVAEVLLRFLPD